MCGIVGLFEPDSRPDPDVLTEMNERLSYRGPDGSGTYIDESVGLGHQRLSIIDLKTGQQPIFNEQNDVVTVFNGEIYNYKQLREDLEKNGHRFSTQTDTEVIVHLYEEYGDSFVTYLDGMFSIALWDSTAERLFLARDPMGIKPLIFAQENGRVAFGSEIVSVLASDLSQGELDHEALAHYFEFGFIPAPYTAFENVRKLKPGELLVITKSGIEHQQFYKPAIPQREPGINAAASKLRQLVKEAVRKRLQSDVPLGAFLSGGIDSSIIVGLMAELSDSPVKTFTIGFEEELFDESGAARTVASYHGTDHHEYTLSADDLRNLIPKVVGSLGEPFADQSLLPSYVVARETSRTVKVALSGDGSDELFGGYDKYRAEYLSRFYRQLPSTIRQEAINPVVNALPTSRRNQLGQFVYEGQWFVERGGEDDVARRHNNWMRIPDGIALQSFQSIEPVEVGQQTVTTEHDQLVEWLPNGNQDDLARIQAVDTRYSLPNQMLTKVDKASMYNSLEVRVPFLDLAVAEYAMSLPTEYKITARKRKRVLKRAFEDILPEEIFERKKQGFDMPISEWFRDDLVDEFQGAMRVPNVGILDESVVADVFEQHVNKQHDHGKFLWSIYVFKKWTQRMRDEGVIE